MLRRPSATGLLALGTGLVLAVAGVLGFYAYSRYHESEDAIAASKLHGERIQLLGDAQTALFQQFGSMVGAGLLNQPERYDSIDGFADRFASDFEKLEPLVPENDPLAGEIAALHGKVDEASNLLRNLTQTLRSGGLGEALTIANESDLSGKMSTLEASIERTIGNEGALLLEAEAREDTARSDVLHSLLAIAGVTLAVIVGSAFAVRQLFTRPLTAVSLAAQEMTAGDPMTRARGRGVRELVDVANAVNTLRDELTRRSGEVEAYLSQNLEARTHELEASNRELLREILERERAESLLRDSEAQLRLAMDAARIGTWEWDIASGRLSWSKNAEAIFETPPAGFEPNITSWLAMIHKDDRQPVARALVRALRNADGRFQVESRYISAADGCVRWIRVGGEVLFDEEHKPVRAVGSVMNVTDEREKGEALARSEEGLRAAQRLTKLGSFVWDIPADHVYWSEGMFALLGYPRSETAPSYPVFLSHVHRDDMAAFEETMLRILAGEPNTFVDCRLVRTDGQMRYIRAAATVEFTDEGAPRRMIATFLDVTESREAEESLRRQRELVAAVVASAPIVLYATDSEGRFTVSQGHALEQLSRKPDEVVGESLFELYGAYPDIVEHARQALAGEMVAYTTDLGGVLFDVSEAPIYDADGQVSGIVGVAVDTSERAKLQEQLVQAQKMESVGRLAGGIAHDFNNLLSAIIGYGELAVAGLEPGSQAGEDIQEAIRAANKAAALTRQLLAFARRQMVDPADVDLNDVVTNLEKLLRRLIGEDVQFKSETTAQPIVAHVDPGQFEQVLVNLAVNARDAMPEGGKLTIETGEATLDAGYAATRPEVEPGRYAVVAVTDTGTGMPPELLDQIFEPFFTTKEQGKGTGLGLATCYGIVKQAGGHIAVYSEPGYGTTLKVYLPLVVSAAVAAAPLLRPVPRDDRGSECILLVEDQAEVRLLTERILVTHGYEVISAANPMKALELASGHDEIDLIISDVVMPGMDGVTMVDVLLRMLGPLPVILMSGYAEESVLSRAMGRPGVEFVSKPLSPESLLTKTREVLSAWRAAHGDISEADDPGELSA